MKFTNPITMPSRPLNPIRRQETYRFNLYWHLRDYHSTRAFGGVESAEEYAACVRKRLEQLGGLAGRW